MTTVSLIAWAFLGQQLWLLDTFISTPCYTKYQRGKRFDQKVLTKALIVQMQYLNSQIITRNHNAEFCVRF